MPATGALPALAALPLALLLALLLAPGPLAPPAVAQGADSPAARQACLEDVARIARGASGRSLDQLASRFGHARQSCESGALEAARIEMSRIQAALSRARAHRGSGGR